MFTMLGYRSIVVMTYLDLEIIFSYNDFFIIFLDLPECDFSS